MKHALFFTLFVLGSFHIARAQDASAPRFPGCEEPNKTIIELEDCAERKLLQFILSNFKHPEAARQAGVSGECLVKITVGVDGSISNPSIVKGLGHGCDEEMLRVLALMPKWIPAMEAGAAAQKEYEFSIMIK